MLQLPPYEFIAGSAVIVEDAEMQDEEQMDGDLETGIGNRRPVTRSHAKCSGKEARKEGTVMRGVMKARIERKPGKATKLGKEETATAAERYLLRSKNKASAASEA